MSLIADVRSHYKSKRSFVALDSTRASDSAKVRSSSAEDFVWLRVTGQSFFFGFSSEVEAAGGVTGGHVRGYSSNRGISTDSSEVLPRNVVP